MQYLGQIHNAGSDVKNSANTTPPAWLATTAYALGDRVANASRYYECIAAGTSAGSGGPTTTAADITDGTAHWTYLGEGTGTFTVPLGTSRVLLQPSAATMMAAASPGSASSFAPIRGKMIQLGGANSLTELPCIPGGTIAIRKTDSGAGTTKVFAI